MAEDSAAAPFAAAHGGEEPIPHVARHGDSIGMPLLTDEEKVHRQQRIDVTVVGARHLPKSDVFGKCDAYLVCELGGVRRYAQPTY